MVNQDTALHDVPPMVLESDPDVIVSRIAYRLTVYLDDPLTWAHEVAAEVFDTFVRTAKGRGLLWYTTSMLSDWHRVSDEGFGQLQENLSNPLLPRVRHQFQFRLVDDTSAPSIGFSYREVDSSRMNRAGVLELTLPLESNPDDLVQLAMHIANRGPCFSAVGGYAVSWNYYLKSTAFWNSYRWCKRFLGLDIQDADAMAWPAVSGLPGTNWLTLVGNPLIAKLGIDTNELVHRKWEHEGITALSMPQGVLVRAGDGPTLGDVNRMEHPAAYAEVARALAPHFVKGIEPYLGGFAVHEKTEAYIRRLLDVPAWIDD